VNDAFRGATDNSSKLVETAKRQNSLIVGIVCGVGGTLLLLLMLILVVFRDPDRIVVQEKLNTATTFIAAALGVLCVALVSVWAREYLKTDPRDAMYLGKVSWEQNVYVWHPLLMVAGFFFCQLMGMLTWSFMQTQPSGKLVHLFWQTAALATLIAGMVAVVDFKKQSLEDSLVTLHSWLGVAALCSFCVAYLWGALMAFLSKFYPDCPIRKTLDMRSIHKVLSLTVFAFTVSTVVTGIMDHMGRSGCNYVGIKITAVEENPASNYNSIPGACKVANGLGMVVMISSITAMIAVSLRKSLVLPTVSAHSGIYPSSASVSVSVPNQKKDDGEELDEAATKLAGTMHEPNNNSNNVIVIPTAVEVHKEESKSSR
jgi:hypothetical protein